MLSALSNSARKAFGNSKNVLDVVGTAAENTSVILVEGVPRARQVIQAGHFVLDDRSKLKRQRKM